MFKNTKILPENLRKYDSPWILQEIPVSEWLEHTEREYDKGLELKRETKY